MTNNSDPYVHKQDLRWAPYTLSDAECRWNICTELYITSMIFSLRHLTGLKCKYTFSSYVTQPINVFLLLNITRRTQLLLTYFLPQYLHFYFVVASWTTSSVLLFSVKRGSSLFKASLKYKKRICNLLTTAVRCQICVKMSPKRLEGPIQL